MERENQHQHQHQRQWQRQQESRNHNSSSTVTRSTGSWWSYVVCMVEVGVVLYVVVLAALTRYDAERSVQGDVDIVPVTTTGAAAAHVEVCVPPTGPALIGAYGGVFTSPSSASAGVPFEMIYQRQQQGQHQVVDDDDTTHQRAYKSALSLYVDTRTDDYYNVNDTNEDNHVRALFYQGLFQLYGFNREEARRNFEECNKLDPLCVACWWGWASSYGPNINSWMTVDDVNHGANIVCQAEHVLQSVQIDSNDNDIYSQKKSQLFGEGKGSFWASLIAAQRIHFGNQPCRHANSTGSDLLSELSAISAESLAETDFNDFNLNTEYSQAMKPVAAQYKDNCDIVTLYVESCIQLTPWDYYDHGEDADRVSPPDSVFDVKPALKRALHEPVQALITQVLDPNRCAMHPLALHLYIHVTEQSTHPELGLEAANDLAVVAAFTGSNHLNHMPAHTFSRVGSFSRAILASQHALDLHSVYNSNCVVLYAPTHDVALMVASAMSAGSLQQALTHAEASALGSIGTGKQIRPMLNVYAGKYVTGLFATPRDLVLCRFGQWQQLIALHQTSALSFSDDVFAPSPAASDSVKRELSIDDIEERFSSYPPFFVVIHLYAQTLAMVHSSKTSGSANRSLLQSRLELLSRYVTRTHSDAPVFHIDHVFYGYQHEIASIMNLTANAAYSLRLSQSAQAVSFLRQAAVLQNNFSYMEPENFYLPLNQCLAATLTNAAKTSVDSIDLMSHGELATDHALLLTTSLRNLQEAVDIYVDELSWGNRPNQGWALKGLMRSLRLADHVISSVLNHNERSWNAQQISAKQFEQIVCPKVVSALNVTRLSLWPTDRPVDCNHQNSRDPPILDQLGALVRSRFQFAWRYADVSIRGPCCELGFC
jgi:hypothetical protein